MKLVNILQSTRKDRSICMAGTAQEGSASTLHQCCTGEHHRDGDSPSQVMGLLLGESPRFPLASEEINQWFWSRGAVSMTQLLLKQRGAGWGCCMHPAPGCCPWGLLVPKGASQSPRWNQGKVSHREQMKTSLQHLSEGGKSTAWISFRRVKFILEQFSAVFPCNPSPRFFFFFSYPFCSPWIISL